MDEGKARDALDRAGKAERLLTDPLLIEAFDSVKSAILARFEEAAIRDEEGVIKAKYLLHALTQVRRVLEDSIRSGKVAEKFFEDKRRGISFLGDVWPSRQPRRR